MLEKSSTKAKLIVLSGCSGSGKTTLCRRLQREYGIVYAVSCTTRQARENEQNGVDYYFISKEQFQQKIAQQAFIEHAEVFNNYYGTLTSEVVAHLQQGRDVILDIDVKGAAQIRVNKTPVIQQAFIDIFITVDSAELAKRLYNRQTDDAKTIQCRLAEVVLEQEQRYAYEHIIQSGSHEQDYRALCQILSFD